MPETADQSKNTPKRRAGGENGSTRSRPALPHRGDPLDALSAATGDFARGSTDGGIRQHNGLAPRQRVTFLFPVLGAIAVGFVLLIAGRNVHLCGGTFRLPENLDPSQRDLCRNTLYDVVSTDLSLRATEDAEHNFFVDFPTRNTLRFAVRSPKNDKTTEQAKRSSDRFLTRIASAFQRAREEPSEGELATIAHLAELESSLANQKHILDLALGDVPQEDRRAERDGLMDEWRRVREKYRTGDARLTEVAGSVEDMRDAPPPSHGVVTADQRRAAFDEDLGLQQDLKELAVSLTEVRSHIGRVQADTASLHTHLADATTRLAQLLSEFDVGKLPKTIRERMTLLSGETDTFRETLASFSSTWTAELVAIRETPVEAQSQELLDRYQRTRSALSAFLFDASKLLARMRGHARYIDTLKTDNGRVMQLQASVSRSFQTLQTFYHRFEFATSQIDRSQNFRLDAALQSARGLHRRSQQRIRQIDEKLQQAALEEMKAFRLTSLRQAEALLEFARGENAATVSTLVDLQDQISERVGSVEHFVTAVARAEMATRNVESLRTTLSKTRSRLEQLKAQRTSRGTNVKIELVTAGILGPPINVGERFRNSAIGAAITLFGLLLGQWWIARRT